MMGQLLRPLLPAAGLALLLTAALVARIRLRPLDLPQRVQVTLSLVLLAAVVALLILVLRVERDDPTGGVDFE